VSTKLLSPAAAATPELLRLKLNTNSKINTIRFHIFTDSFGLEITPSKHHFSFLFSHQPGRFAL
jgi:hypothetical protein